MDFLDWLTVIGFVLSTYLSISKIRSSLIKIKIDNISSQLSQNFITIRFIVSNRSSQYRAITDAYISQKSNGVVIKADIYEKVLAHNIRKRNNEIQYRNEILSNKIPINVTPNSAMSVLLSFPINDINDKVFVNSRVKLELKIENKFVNKEFYINGKSDLAEQLMKAAKR